MSYISAKSVFHAQESSRFCAAAVALTMLSDQDVGIAVDSLRESVVFEEAHKRSARGWGVDPTGLEYVLNSAFGMSNVKFERYFSDSEPEGTTRIVAGISINDAVAVAVLVYGRRHWVAVNGVEVDGDPRSGAYTLRRLWVFDPEAQKFPQPRHSDSDRCPNLGVRDFGVFYGEGWRKLFTGSHFGSKKKFVNIARDNAGMVLPPGHVNPPVVSPGKDIHGLIRPEFIEEVWNAWVDAFGGWPDGSPGAVLRDAKPAGFNKVGWIENEDEVLFLLRLEKEPEPGGGGLGEIVGTCIMNARSGSLHSVKTYTETSAHKAAIERLRGDLAGAELVWQPCLESFSPHFPFRIITEGSLKRFERLDGKIFNELTSKVRGK